MSHARFFTRSNLSSLVAFAVLLLGVPPTAFAGGEKVTICHVPPGDPENAHEIVVSASAVAAHLANHEGDAIGPCETPPECMSDDQCDDANPCTIDACTPDGACDYSVGVSCDDGNPCTSDVCLPDQGGCVGVPNPGASCDDGVVCTAPDLCDASGQCAGGDVPGCCRDDAFCADGNACTADACDEATGACSNDAISCPEPAACEVGFCDAASGCGSAPVTCPDDGNICTVEACDPSIGDVGACATQPNPYPPEPGAELSCNDGLDNDCDGAVDSRDSDCACPCVTQGSPYWKIDSYWGPWLEPRFCGGPYPASDVSPGSYSWVVQGGNVSIGVLDQPDPLPTLCGTVSGGVAMPGSIATIENQRQLDSCMATVSAIATQIWVHCNWFGGPPTVP